MDEVDELGSVYNKLREENKQFRDQSKKLNDQYKKLMAKKTI